MTNCKYITKNGRCGLKCSYAYRHGCFGDDMCRCIEPMTNADRSRRRMTMPDLKPCPFCGGEAKAMRWSVTYEIEIQCTNEDCDAFQDGTVFLEDGESEESAYNRAYEIAKEKWNRRPGERKEGANNEP